MHSVVIDTETLHTSPSSLITEIGVIAFEPVQHSEDNEIVVCDHLEIYPDFWEQLSAGRETNADTIAFHRKNGTLPILPNPHSIPCIEAATQISAFIREHKPKHVWIQGTDFDRPLIENFFKWLGRPLPWHFGISRDARTLCDLAFPGEKHSKRPHKALADCMETLDCIRLAHRKLNLKL